MSPNTIEMLAAQNTGQETKPQFRCFTKWAMSTILLIPSFPEYHIEVISKLATWIFSKINNNHEPDTMSAFIICFISFAFSVISNILAIGPLEWRGNNSETSTCS